MNSDRVLVARDLDATDRILARPVVIDEVAEGFRECVQVVPDRDLADLVFLTSPRFVVVYVTAQDRRYGSVAEEPATGSRNSCATASRYSGDPCTRHLPTVRNSAAASLNGLTWSLSSWDRPLITSSRAFASARAAAFLLRSVATKSVLPCTRGRPAKSGSATSRLFLRGIVRSPDSRFYPFLHIAVAISDESADSRKWWALSGSSPICQRVLRNS